MCHSLLSRWASSKEKAFAIVELKVYFWGWFVILSQSVQGKKGPRFYYYCYGAKSHPSITQSPFRSIEAFYFRLWKACLPLPDEHKMYIIDSWKFCLWAALSWLMELDVALTPSRKIYGHPENSTVSKNGRGNWIKVRRVKMQFWASSHCKICITRPQTDTFYCYMPLNRK